MAVAVHFGSHPAVRDITWSTHTLWARTGQPVKSLDKDR